MALDISFIQILILVFQVVSLILLFGLFNIYRKSYKQIKIGYTIGLLIFALLLIAKSLVELAISMFLISTGNVNAPIVEDRTLIPATIELIAIAVLYKVTKDY